ncbi:MAG TPA: PaaI family thioesterase [Pseudolysinimonas sp.]
MADAAGFAMEQAQQILRMQAFSRLLGTELLEFGDGRAVLALDLHPDHTQQNGFAHGGILAYLVDNAITFAAGTVLGPKLLTAGMGVEYLRPATGPRLVATAVVTASTRRRAVASCTVTDGDRVVAVGQGTAQALDESDAA